MLKITIEGLPEDLKKLLAQRVSAWEEPEIVTLPDGRKATASRKKYTGADPLHEWITEGVINNIMAAAPEWFATEQASHVDEIARQKRLRDEALAKLLKGTNDAQ